MPDIVTLDTTEASWRHHATVFFQRTGMPYVAGAIDGTYIRIANIQDETGWWCHDRYPAINLTIVTDSCRMIRFATCRMAGSCHDITVYRQSALYERVQNGWRPFPNAVILGDSGYTGAGEFIIPMSHTGRLTNPNFYKFVYIILQI